MCKKKWEDNIRGDTRECGFNGEMVKGYVEGKNKSYWSHLCGIKGKLLLLKLIIIS